MGGTCSCIPPPASQQPRKVYNVLVPDVFPGTAPAIGHALSVGVERKIEKLEEYVLKNPARISKVSRRLMRKIKHGLYNKQYGFVEIAVHAYVRLLGRSTREGSTFSFTYFSTELIHQPDTVISTLLAYPEPEVKAMGAKLLAAYIAAQDEVENQRDAVQPLVATVCTLGGKHRESKADPVATESLTIACLQALTEYVGLCHKLKALPANLEQIEEVLLSNLDLAVVDPGEAKGTSALPTAQNASAADMSRALLLQFKPFLQDVGTVYRVMETLFKYLDRNGKWQQGEIVQRLMDLVQRSCADQPFPLFTALIRHSSKPGLSTADRTTIVKLAMQQESVYSLSAFSLALQELPVCLTQASSAPSAAAGAAGGDSGSEQQALRDAVHTAVAQLAREVGDASQLCEAVSSSLRQHPPGSPTLPAALDCALHALGVLKELLVHEERSGGRLFTGRAFPASFLMYLAATITAPVADVAPAGGAVVGGAPATAVGGAVPPEAHRAALRMLAATLPSCGPAVGDAGQAGILLGVASVLAAKTPQVTSPPEADGPSAAAQPSAAAAASAAGEPEDIATIDAVVRACAGGRQPEVLLNVARLLTELHCHAVTVATSSAGGSGTTRARQWACALLVAANSVTSVLADAAACPVLRDMRGFDVPEAALGGCLVVGSGGAIVAAEPAFIARGDTDAAATAALTAAAAASDYPSRVVDALCKEGLLAEHFGDSLRGRLAEAVKPRTSLLPQLGSSGAITGTSGAEAGGTRSAPAQAQQAEPGPAPAELSQRLTAMAHMACLGSVRHDRLNLQHVMDLLGGGAAGGAVSAGQHNDNEHGGAGAAVVDAKVSTSPVANGSTAGAGADSSGAGAVSVEDVLALLAQQHQQQQPPAGKAAAQQHLPAAQLLAIRPPDLAKQLEAVIG